MSTTVVRIITGGGPNGPVDSATALAEEQLTASGTAATTTITTSGKADEVVVVYPLSSNVRVAFGATATVSTGPIAFAGMPNTFRNVGSGNTISVIEAT